MTVRWNAPCPLRGVIDRGGDDVTDPRPPWIGWTGGASALVSG